jgi:hypothetical protein
MKRIELNASFITATIPLKQTLKYNINASHATSDLTATKNFLRYEFRIGELHHIKQSRY